MSLSDKDVRHVAKLAALELPDDKIEEYQKALNDILDHVTQLSAVDTDGVKPTSHVHGVVNAFRDDITKDSLSEDEVKKLAPDYSSSGFRVPKII